MLMLCKSNCARLTPEVLQQKTNGCHKLLSPWECPFIITKVTGPGTYKLITEDGKEVNNTWHISQLRRFYARKQLKEEYIYKPQEINVHDQ